MLVEVASLAHLLSWSLIFVCTNLCTELTGQLFICEIAFFIVLILQHLVGLDTLGVCLTNSSYLTESLYSAW